MVSKNLPRNSVEYKNNTSINHVPFVPSQVVHNRGYEVVLLKTETLEHGLLPEAATPQVSREGIDDTKGYNALDGTGDHAQSQGMSVVLVPGLNIKCQQSCDSVSNPSFSVASILEALTGEEREDRFPSLA
jgi:hypothetical protein